MSFLFVSSEVEFQETTPKGARVAITMLELNKESQQGTEYNLEEGEQIAKSLVGDPIYYGTDWQGKHKKSNPIGVVESAKVIGSKIKGIILVHSQELVDMLKRGVKFLFSVGGTAKFAEAVNRGGRIIRRMIGAVCDHLAMVPLGTKVGFPSAKIEKVLEINETVMFISEDEDYIDELIVEGIVSGAIKGTIIAKRR